MASNQTERYGLSQWEKSDKVLMEDFNADNAKLDAALAAQAEAMEDKADVTALEALARTVNTLSGTVSGQSSTLSRKGNCQIYYSTYVGAGPYGSAHPGEAPAGVDRRRKGRRFPDSSARRAGGECQ